jgi:hypothetical protein
LEEAMGEESPLRIAEDSWKKRAEDSWRRPGWRWRGEDREG